MVVSPQWLFTLKLLTALGCGLAAGVFFAFSTFIMPALARLQAPQGIAAMQSINITAINPLFMIALFGTALACLFLAVSVLFKWQQSGAVYLLVGSLLYLVGTIGVTIAFNVPLNDALAIVKPDSSEGATLWTRYLTGWTFWNHVRTIAALVAATLFTLVIANSEKI
ncbi:MAG: DUF1772 domain-containing protein [Plectolyngbya sp. WJT66-NPBG17]|jgi:uncharacterized membrane protein|nr:DUF1772 domain-containing protein [Plectolyngbya sp. WJT66-NPBG17]MBW4529021.1 DUF1772 domain-containing protein [Phormidium tanganyikae FI6-MK23]